MLSDQLKQQIQDRWRHSCEMSVTELEAHARCDISTLLQAAAEADQRIAAAEEMREIADGLATKNGLELLAERQKNAELVERIAAAEQQRDEKEQQIAMLKTLLHESRAESQRLREALEQKMVEWERAMKAEYATLGLEIGGDTYAICINDVRSILAGSVPQET